MKSNDLYLYFQVTDAVNPDSILDIGMLLKRAGAVGRCATGCSLPEKLRLDGVDFMPEVNFPVWRHVYNNIFLPEEEAFYTYPYDMAVLITDRARAEYPDIIKRLAAGSMNYFLTNQDNFSDLLPGWECRALSSDQDKYWLFIRIH